MLTYRVRAAARLRIAEGNGIDGAATWAAAVGDGSAALAESIAWQGVTYAGEIRQAWRTIADLLAIMANGTDAEAADAMAAAVARLDAADAALSDVASARARVADADAALQAARAAWSADDDRTRVAFCDAMAAWQRATHALVVAARPRRRTARFLGECR